MAGDANPTPSGQGDVTPPAGTDPKTPAPTAGTDPAKKPDSGSQGFDPSTLSDEDFAKFYADPRTFNHPRFKSLDERAREADKLKADADKAANDQLEKDKKFQELATKHETSAKEWQGKYQQSLIDSRIQTEANKLGITDLEAATKLIDRTGISIDDSGTVTGVEEAVKALSESKTYLVDKSKQVPTIGSPTNPGSGNNAGEGSVKTFKASEIRDPAFYKEHEKDILAAMKVPGAITNDLGN